MYHCSSREASFGIKTANTDAGQMELKSIHQKQINKKAGQCPA
jgi:hypothetical protein